MRFALAQLNFTVGAFEQPISRRLPTPRARARGRAPTWWSSPSWRRPAIRRATCCTTALHRRQPRAARSRRGADRRDARDPRRAASAQPGGRRQAALQHRRALPRRPRRRAAPRRRCCRPTTSSTRTATSSRAPTSTPIDFKGVRLGLTVCEEVWNDRDFWPRRLYPRDPVCELAAAGADVLVNISSSPFTIGKAASGAR